MDEFVFPSCIAQVDDKAILDDLVVVHGAANRFGDSVAYLSVIGLRHGLQLAQLPLLEPTEIVGGRGIALIPWYPFDMVAQCQKSFQKYDLMGVERVDGMGDPYRFLPPVPLFIGDVAFFP